MSIHSANHENIVSPLENAGGNLAAQEYWNVLPEIVGSEYHSVAGRNSHDLKKAHLGMYGEQLVRRGDEVLSPADCATEWYLKLGTHNSLYGLRNDLTHAAATVILDVPRSEAGQNHVIDLVTEIRADERLALKDPQRTVLAAEMLIDAVRDPKPYQTPEQDGALRVGLTETARIATGQVKEALLKRAETRHKLDMTEQETYCGALKFNFEANAMLIGLGSDEAWQARYDRLLEKAQTQGVNTESHRLALTIDGPEELKDHALLQETLQQCGELEVAADYLTNGELNELYFNLMLRHLILSKNNHAEVMSATQRQDMPHDKIKHTPGLSVLSHDAILKDYVPDRTLYVQLKAGDISGKPDDQNTASTGYHPDIVMINPFGETSDNVEIRKQTLEGLHQLRGVIGELVTGRYYEGSVSMLESHVDRIKQAIHLKLDDTHTSPNTNK